MMRDENLWRSNPSSRSRSSYEREKSKISNWYQKTPQIYVNPGKYMKFMRKHHRIFGVFNLSTLWVVGRWIIWFKLLVYILQLLICHSRDEVACTCCGCLHVWRLYHQTRFFNPVWFSYFYVISFCSCCLSMKLYIVLALESSKC